ncbi:MAG TPA: hypothetical protein DD417_03410 [Elusimicrobia bacterium]|nr:hypothetical protein [Elusimicrobiota bacterium]
MGCAILLLLTSVLAGPAGAGEDKPFYKMAEPEIAAALRTLHDPSPLVGKVSERFVGTPYHLGPLGEGEKGDFDRDPLMRFDAVDCTTFVEEVLALALEPEPERAKQTLQKIRYKDGVVRYASRNHFPEADWIPNNEAAGYLEDITRVVAGDDVRVSSKVIDKAAWYLHKTTADLQGVGKLSAEEKVELVGRLRQETKGLSPQAVAVPYLPIEFLPDYAARIPAGTVVSFVRENSPAIPVLISHQGLVVEKNGVKLLRHASATDGKVSDVPLLEYAYRYFNAKWRLLGLNLQALRRPSR